MGIAEAPPPKVGAVRCGEGLHSSVALLYFRSQAFDARLLCVLRADKLVSVDDASGTLHVGREGSVLEVSARRWSMSAARG